VLVGMMVIYLLVTIIAVLFLFRASEAMHIEIQIKDFYPWAVVSAVGSMCLMFALNGCYYGLAFDLMSSGDEYTNFKSAFNYFRKFAWQYLVISLLQSLLSLPMILLLSPEFKYSLFTPDKQFLWYLIGILLYVISWLWCLFFVIAMPSITAQGSLKRSLQESIAILKENPKRLIKTSGMIFLIFSLPIMIGVFIQYFSLSNFDSNGELIYNFIYFPLLVIEWCVGSPLSVLMYTRIYNTTPVIKHQSGPKPVKIDKYF
jgi:hypothetical protein